MLPGRTRQYIIDGTEIIVPRHLYENFEGAGLVKNKEGEISCGYKVVWIQEIIDRKGVIRSMKFAPIQTHDLYSTQFIFPAWKNKIYQ